MELLYKRAGLSDLEQLTEIRMRVVRALHALPPSVDLSAFAAASRRYYEESLVKGTHVSYLAFADGMWAGAGDIDFYQVLPSYRNSSGKKAYIMNLYTEPVFRKQGIASAILDLLVKEARERGVSSISLKATEMGRPLYDKYGFVSVPEEMALPEETAFSIGKRG